MSKVLIVSQPHGLGDFLFTQTIANDYIAEGYKVLWPTKAEWVPGLRLAYPNIEWIDAEMVPIDLNRRTMSEENGVLYLPMRFSEHLMGKPYKFHMESKYSYLGKDWRRWREGAYPKRNITKELSLMKELGISEGDKYNLIQTVYGSDGNYKIELDLKNAYRNIDFTQTEGYSLFDWCSIIENAENIYSVSSSSLYLFEILSLKAKEVHIYTRLPIEQNLDFVKFFITKNFILHE